MQMEKWVFKTTEIDLVEDEVKVSFSKEMEETLSDLLTTAFGVDYLRAGRTEKEGMIHISFKASVDDIENFHDAMVNYYLEKYGDSGHSLLYGGEAQS